MRAPVLALFAAFALTATASARLVPDWPYEKLFDEADLVVIARATGNADVADRLEEGAFKDALRGVNTTFDVKRVLKGEHAKPTLTLLHFRVEEGKFLLNGPLLVTFRTEGVRLDLKSSETTLGVPEYLLFLKARPDGRFEAVSGQIDPELSVRELHAPLPPGVEKAKTKESPAAATGP